MPRPDQPLPDSLRATFDGDIATLTVDRPEKRNALDDATVLGIETFFRTLPTSVKAIVLHGSGDHFSAGLDLSELTERNVQEGIAHSRFWHRVFDVVEYGGIPVIAVLHGAVVGGGLELAAACHVRIAESSAYYGLPEGSRGIFVGGGGSVRIPRLIGVSRMMEMMLTGRTYGAAEGYAMGISHYVVEPGLGLAKGLEVARRVAGNTVLTNYAITQVLPRIAQAAPEAGLMMEALIAAVAQDDGEAKSRLKDFLEKRGPKALHG